MILTCPKCASRFNLSAYVLAPEGKRVKCSACGESWFQLPDPDELLSEIEMQESGEEVPIEDIPDAVKPIPEGSSVPALAGESNEQAQKPTNKKLILASALCMFLLLSMPLIAFKNPIMAAWPESIAFYNLLGLSGNVPGEGIVFDQMRAEIEENILILTGQVINLTTADSQLPLIEVTLKDQADEPITHHYIRMPKEVLSAEETLPIKAEYEIEDPQGIFGASIRFVLKPKN